MRRVAVAIVAGIALIVPATALGTHPRPKSASPIRAPLVPAHKPCDSPDLQHGPALYYPSCSGPQQTSDYLTIGTADANGYPTKSVGSFFWKIVPGTPGPPTDNGVGWLVEITDVRCTAAGPGCGASGADYAGSVEVRYSSQITDHFNNVNPGGGSDPATTQPFDFGFPVTCTMTSDPSIGSTCRRLIQYIEELGITITDTRRTLWEFDRVQVWDGGADADGSTKGDNALFAVQGLFVP